MFIEYKNCTYASIEHFKVKEQTLEKMYSDLKKAEENEAFIWEQYIRRDIGILKGIHQLQIEHDLDILNYYCQSCADYNFIETVDGTKYVYLKYERKIKKDDQWSMVRR